MRVGDEFVNKHEWAPAIMVSAVQPPMGMGAGSAESLGRRERRLKSC
jgi:hypothetical protein